MRFSMTSRLHYCASELCVCVCLRDGIERKLGYQRENERERERERESERERERERER